MTTLSDQIYDAVLSEGLKAAETVASDYEKQTETEIENLKSTISNLNDEVKDLERTIAQLNEKLDSFQ